MSCGTENVRIEPVDVYMGADQEQVQDVVCVESTASASLTNKYFLLYASDGSKYYAWFDVNNTGVDPALSGYTGIEVDIGANPQTAVQVATALQAAVDALGDFVATVSGYTVRITDAAVGYAIPAHDAQATASKTGFAFNMITVGDEYEKLGMIDGDVEISGLSRSPVDITSHQTWNRYYRSDFFRFRKSRKLFLSGLYHRAEWSYPLSPSPFRASKLYHRR